MAPNVRPILLVEDEDDDVEFVRRALALRRILNPVLVIPEEVSARRFLRRSVESKELPVLAIVDIYLSRGGSGLSLLAWMRSLADLATLPVVILTVSTDRTHQAQAMAHGAAVVLNKPITVELAAEAITSLGVTLTRGSVNGRQGAVLEPAHE